MILPRSIRSRLRLSGILVFLGLIIEAFTLRWPHPLAFLVFAFVGVPVQLAGILVFLYSLLTLPADES